MLQESPAALRRRLFNPRNAVEDQGIDLKRKPKVAPVEIEKPEPPKIEENVFERNCQRYFEWQVAPPQRRKHQPNMQEIVVYVAGVFGVTAMDIHSDRRTADIVLPRQISMWLAKQVTGKSMVFIGNHIGGRDHTTVLSAVRKIDRLRLEDPELQYRLDLCLSALRSTSENGNAADTAGIGS